MEYKGMLGHSKGTLIPMQPLIGANIVFLGQVFWNQSLMG